jgi:8-oxo-dGTP pyrophosphatase MutT (NUDIX family)
MSNNKIKILKKREILLFKKKFENNFNENSCYNISENKHLFNFNKKKYIQSAVLCLIEQNYKEECINIILTERSKELRNHAGQISFPGGKLDETDKNNFQKCAFREAEEEIGFKSRKSIYLGKLNKYITGTGYIIQPVVAFSKEKQDFILNKNEVTTILHFPINYLLSKNRIKKVFYNNKSKFYFCINWNNFKVWGATAKILIDLITLLMVKK